MEYILLIVLLAILAVILIYNRLVKYRNRVDAAWSDIEVQLKRRYNLVPQLVAAVKQYAAYEKQTLVAITSLRTLAEQEVSPHIKAPLDGELNDQVLQLLAVAESYPDLKANENFMDLQKELVDIENIIEKSRRFYNGSVREYNTAIEVFPNNLVAKYLQFFAKEFYSVDR